ncbi:MAG: hypothetical protein ACLUTU_18475 [Blautia faecis]
MSAIRNTLFPLIGIPFSISHLYRRNQCYYDLRNTNTTRDSWYSNVDIYVYRDSKYVEHNANGYLEDVYLEGGETYYSELSQYEGDNFHTITFKVTYIC